MGHILCNNQQTINEIFASGYNETRPTLVVRFMNNTGIKIIFLVRFCNTDELSTLHTNAVTIYFIFLKKSVKI